MNRAGIGRRELSMTTTSATRSSGRNAAIDRACSHSSGYSASNTTLTNVKGRPTRKGIPVLSRSTLRSPRSGVHDSGTSLVASASSR